MRREACTEFIRAFLIEGAEKMTEQEELHDEDVIVVISDEEGVEHYYREEMNTEGDTEPVGIVMGAYEDKLMVKYATQNIYNQLFVSRYQLYLPNREQLESEINRILEQNEQ